VCVISEIGWDTFTQFAVFSQRACISYELTCISHYTTYLFLTCLFCCRDFFNGSLENKIILETVSEWLIF
jgi:hypothetical protein